MADHELREKILSRLEQQEATRITKLAHKAVRQEAVRQEQDSIEHNLSEAARMLRDQMCEHHTLRNRGRVARWFGKRAVPLFYAQESELTLRERFDMILDLHRLQKEGVITPEEANKQKFEIRHDFRKVLYSPVLLTEAPRPEDGHMFEYGWQVALERDGKDTSRTWQNSSVYMYRTVTETHSGEVARELTYVMEGEKGLKFKLRSYTDGVVDDPWATVGKHAAEHALWLMQGALAVFAAE